MSQSAKELGKLAREINANATINKNQRPVVVHKHTKGEWYFEELEPKKIICKDENNNPVMITNCNMFDRYKMAHKILLRKSKDNPREQNSIRKSLMDLDLQDFANARLISQAPILLQIAEMYFDSMQGKGMEDSLPYKVTLETLKKINPK